MIRAPQAVHVAHETVGWMVHRPQITYVGTNHGQQMPLARGQSEIAESALFGNRGPLLTENFEPTWQFLPEKLMKEAKPMETYGVVAEASNVLNKIRQRDPRAYDSALDKIDSYTRSEVREYHRQFERPKAKRVEGHMPEKTLRPLLFKTFKSYAGKRFSNAEIHQAIGFVRGVRTFIMASHVVEHAAKNAYVGVTGGSAHLGQIARFVNNPKLHERYGRFALAMLKKHAPESKHMQSEVAKALQRIQTVRQSAAVQTAIPRRIALPKAA